MLEIEALGTGYGAVPVLNDVNIRVGAGEFVAIVGPNGAGKTTLFKTISGIVPPMSGVIRFEGRDLLAVAPSARPHLGIAHVPEGRQVFPSLTVLENLEMGAATEAGRRNWAENLDKVYTWFPVLAERASAQAGALSGGQQQMLAIARGLASSPKLLMVEQRVAEALHFATRGYVLEAGRVVLEGSHDELKSNDRIRQAYLGM